MLLFTICRELKLVLTLIMVSLSPQVFIEVSKDSEKARCEWTCFVNLWGREAAIYRSVCFSAAQSCDALVYGLLDDAAPGETKQKF